MECNQEDWSVFNKFRIITPYVGTYFLEVSARFSLNEATKVSLEPEKLDFLGVV